MRNAAPIRLAASAALLVVAFALAPGNAVAQGAGNGAGAGAAVQDAAKPARSRKKAEGPKKEPTAGQMAARERQRKCAGEWKVAKAGGKTGSTKWPQFWSQCNTRLKEQRA